MRKIAVVGAGPAGLLAAIGLHDQGYDVTLVSDRTARQWREQSRPTGTAAIHIDTRAIIARYGLNFYDRCAPEFEGFDLVFRPFANVPAVRLMGRLKDGGGHAIDLRLMCHDWINEYIARGGRFVHQEATLEDLEDLAASNDLVLLAAGKSQVFNAVLTRNAERSVYERPPRHLCMLNLAPFKEFETPYRPMRFNAFAEWGEYFWVPYYSATRGKSWSLVIEAKPGLPLDRFHGKIKTGAEGVAAIKEFIREHVPWEFDQIKDMEVTDELGWLTGAFAPTVREPVGRLPSGRMVLPIGDTVMAYDPIGGLGMNNGIHYSGALIDQVVARRDAPFDEAWARAGFEAFYARYGRHAYAFNNALIEPITPPFLEILMAGGTSFEIGTEFFSNFNTPAGFFPAVESMAEARAFIERHAGEPYLAAALRGRMNVNRTLLGQTLQRAIRLPEPVATAA